MCLQFIPNSAPADAIEDESTDFFNLDENSSDFEDTSDMSQSSEDENSDASTFSDKSASMEEDNDCTSSGDENLEDEIVVDADDVDCLEIDSSERVLVGGKVYTIRVEDPDNFFCEIVVSSEDL